MSISFTKLGKFSLIIFYISFQFLALPLLLWHAYDLDVGKFGDVPEAPYFILIFLNSFFFLLFSLNVFFFLTYVPNFWFDSLLPPFHCYLPVDFSLFHLMQPSFLPGSFFMLFHYLVSSLSILITSVWNSASDRLLNSISFRSFSGVLFCSFLWTIFLCLSVWQPPCVCCHSSQPSAWMYCKL